MVRSDKDNAEGSGRTDEGEEIDRIMQEIEDLEKKMDSPDQDARSTRSSEEPGNVVPFRSSSVESLAETDAVPASDEPLMRSSSDTADGSLALKVGGCAEVSLEFSRLGMTVTLTCNQEALVITTDQGAEFRVPFKRAA